MNITQTLTPEACRVARARARLSQQALARRAGISRATLINFEAGKGKPLNASVAAIRSALGQGSRLARVLRALQAAEPQFRARGVTRLAVFGSVARMEDGPDSDVDLVADIDPARKFDIVDLAGIAGLAQDVLGSPVDVVRRRPDMKPRLAQNIAEDEIHVF
jgi:predicted nucleotidyltransferase/DNA-binding XRE family transcriptional regulator